jgi:hypothetical protein
VTGSDSDALSESESDESARQEKALGLAKREMTVGGENLVCVGSCPCWSCFVLSFDLCLSSLVYANDR